MKTICLRISGLLLCLLAGLLPAGNARAAACVVGSADLVFLPDQCELVQQGQTEFFLPPGSPFGPSVVAHGIRVYETHLTPGAGPGAFDSFFDVFVDVTDPANPTRMLTFPNLGVPGIGQVEPPPPSPLPAPLTVPVELVQLSLVSVNPIPIMVRESPTLQSVGNLGIFDLGNGLFQVDSFFDIWIEVSLDGGQSWLGGSGPMHLALQAAVPEPATLVLLGLGLAGLGMARRRRAYA